MVFDAATKHDIASVTKSVTSRLVGIAFDRKWLKDLDASVFSFFPEYDDLRTPEKDRLTLRHLLTMSTGLDWNETKLGSELGRRGWRTGEGLLTEITAGLARPVIARQPMPLFGH